MSPLARRVLRASRRRGLLASGERVAIAVSGGSDSVALAWLLREIESAGGCAVAGLVHLNHGLRGQESADDEAFCRALADRIGWPIDVGRIDAAALARSQSQSIETAARTARYLFFEAAARRLEADAVATGHTIDDQAETVLLRLLRGAGSRGLAGIRARRGPYVRPLLEFRRAELRRYLGELGEGFREDSSNQNLSIARNRIRHELMPVIARLAPGGSRALARLAALAQDDEAFLHEATIEASRSLVLSEGVGFRLVENSGDAIAMESPEFSTSRDPTPLQLDCAALARLPAALGRRVVRELAQQVDPGAALTTRHIEAVRELAAADKPNGHLDLPGLVVQRRSGVLTVRGERGGPVGRDRPAGGRRAHTAFNQALPVPGAVRVAEAGVTIAASIGQAAGRPAAGGDRNVAMLQAASLTLPLAVRSRRPGDRFRPLGAPGRKKLQDLMVDRKVPRDERDDLPIVVDAAGQIVWVVGLAIAEQCRVTVPEEGVVILQVRPS